MGLEEISGLCFRRVVKKWKVVAEEVERKQEQLEVDEEDCIIGLERIRRLCFLGDMKT